MIATRAPTASSGSASTNLCRCRGGVPSMPETRQRPAPPRNVGPSTPNSVRAEVNWETRYPPSWSAPSTASCAKRSPITSPSSPRVQVTTCTRAPRAQRSAQWWRRWSASRRPGGRGRTATVDSPWAHKLMHPVTRRTVEYALRRRRHRAARGGRRRRDHPAAALGRAPRLPLLVRHAADRRRRTAARSGVPSDR